MSIEWIIGTVITVVLFVIGTLIALVVRMGDRFRDAEDEITILKTQMFPLWSQVQAKISKDLTHPSVQFKEMDELLHRLEEMTITSGERTRLGTLLDERIESDDPEVSESEKESARLMKGVMAKVVTETFNQSGG